MSRLGFIVLVVLLVLADQLQWRYTFPEAQHAPRLAMIIPIVIITVSVSARSLNCS